MLEVVNAPGFIRQGEAKILGDTAFQGFVGFISGVDSEGTTLIKMPYTSAEAAKCYYPIKKLRFEEDLSDTSSAVDLLKNGDRCIYYEGGEFWTDRCSRKGIAFGRVLPAATAFGRFVDTVVHTVVPTLALYVRYGAYNRGMLGASAVATTQVGPNFRMIEAWGSTAASVDRGTTLRVRFKVVPGFVGSKF